MNRNDILAMDRGSVRSVDMDGRMRVEVSNISKANVCEYYGREIQGFQDLGLDPSKRYRLLRDPEELKKAAATFNGIQLLSRHVKVSADDPQKLYVVGTTGTDAQFDYPYLRNSLVVWDAEAIEGIEDHSVRQLSCGYRYKADMTPGQYEGERYDGVMRNIIGNHVCLVPDGRAGDDVIVGDSALEPSTKNPTNQEKVMKKTTMLTPRAALVKGALLQFYRPQMAMDSARTQFSAVLSDALKGVGQRNWKQKKPALAQQIVTGLKTSLAFDADLKDVVELLDKLDGGSGPAENLEEAAVDPDMNLDLEGAEGSADDPAMGGQEAAPPEGDMAETIKGILMGKVDDAVLAAVLQALTGAPPAGNDADPEPQPEDDASKDKDPTMISKMAMDAAIKTASAEAVTRARQEAAALRAAEREVRPFVGEMAMAFDSAEQVYREALALLGVPTKGVHASALQPMLHLAGKQQQRGPAREPAKLAMDANTISDFAKRFPNARSPRHA